MDTAFLTARIAAIKLAIVATESALIALAAGAQSYSLDTGQNRTTVTKADARSLQINLNSQLNMLAVYEKRLNGSGVQVRPAW